jgi:hypothetical protein
MSQRSHWWLFLALSACASPGPTPTPEAEARIDASAGKLDAGPLEAVADAARRDAGTLDAGRRDEPDAPAPSAPAPSGRPYANPPKDPRCEGRWRPPVDTPTPSFTRSVIARLPGAGYLLPRDLDGDGAAELLVTSLSVGLDLTAPGGGPPLAAGAASVLAPVAPFTRGTLPRYAITTAFGADAGVLWPNASALFDVDGDQRDDWVIGAGFLTKPVGALVWLRGGVGTRFEAPVRIPVPDATCFYHEAKPSDVDGDGDLDFFTTCHVGSATDGASRLELFENQGGGTFTAKALGAGGGALLTLLDVDGDGDDDLVVPQFFEAPALAWYEQVSPTQLVPHVIDGTRGRGFVVKLGDVDGDGRTDLVFGNHNNEVAETPAERTMGIYWYRIPEPSELAGLADWTSQRRTIYEGFEVAGDDNAVRAGAPGMLQVADLDGDCDLDVTASGDGDLGLYAFFQGPDGFTRLVLDEGPGNVNSGEQHALDLDGDGDTDLAWAVFGSNDPLALLGGGLASEVRAYLQGPASR